ncbi:MAG: hypothetical protein L3J39_02885 [Verrucomicrobiales bacterium]|nr:hypothetical protein [Verrucomicrobiales bacterium]
MLITRKDVEKPEAGHFAANGHEGSEKALDLLRNREMLTIEDLPYSANEIYSDFDYFFSKGFTTYGSSWFRYKNIRSHRVKSSSPMTKISWLGHLP